MNDSISIYVILSTVISLVVLIVFFVMALNLNQIKKMFIAFNFDRIKEDLEIEPDDIWICPYCTSENKADSYKCKSCNYNMTTSLNAFPGTKRDLEENKSI